MGKSRGKGGAKTNHRKGGPKYVANAEEIEARNKTERATRRRDGDDDDDVDDVDDLDDEMSGFSFDRSAAASAADDDEPVRKPKGAAGVIQTANPNDTKVKNIKIKDLGKLGNAPNPEAGMTRREREELEAQRKREAYQKLHKEGKTDEYKKDMERLQAARARREEAQKQAKEDEEARKQAEEAAKQAAAAQVDDDDSIEKLDPREIKKMNPKQLKEHLKDRGLSTQGAKKDLIARLLAAN